MSNKLCQITIRILDTPVPVKSCGQEQSFLCLATEHWALRPQLVLLLHGSVHWPPSHTSVGAQFESFVHVPNEEILTVCTCLCFGLKGLYCVSKKYWPISHIKLQYKMGRSRLLGQTVDVRVHELTASMHTSLCA